MLWELTYSLAEVTVMIGRQLAVFCAALLVWTSNTWSSTPTSAGPEAARPSVAEQAASLPLGSVVVVRTLDKKTLTGRLGQLTATGFELQRGKGNSVVTETLAFADVKSIKPKSHGMSTGAKIAIGAVIGAAAVFALAGIAVAASGW
jgi:hypothetical protein